MGMSTEFHVCDYEESKDLSNIQNNIKLFEYANVDKNSQILEIGCGAGRFSNYIYEQGYKNLTAIEVSETGITIAKKSNPNIKFLLQESDILPFQDNSFDVCMSYDVIEHIPDIKHHIKEINRVLKNGGLYLFSTPNKYSNIPWEIWQTKSFEYRTYHPSLQTHKQLRKLFEDEGFCINIQKIDPRTKFNLDLIEEKMSKVGRLIFNNIPFNRLPLSCATNFYCIAMKFKDCNEK